MRVSLPVQQADDTIEVCPSSHSDGEELYSYLRARTGSDRATFID
jgi:hypothetical protein